MAPSSQRLEPPQNPGRFSAFCAQGIEKRLSKLPATQAVYVDLKQKVVVVQAKDGQVLDTKTITAEITDAGYDVTKLETVEQSVAEIKANMKAKPGVRTASLNRERGSGRRC
jgi:copper chaperone CopZ